MKKLPCSQCRRVKPETEFAPRPDTRRGRRSECNVCKKEMNRTYYKTNRYKVLSRLEQRRLG